AAPSFQGDIDRDALALMLRHNAIPAPYSIYRGIGKLPPGTWVRIRESDMQAGALPLPTPYWSVAEAATSAMGRPFLAGSGEATDALEGLLLDAVDEQMMADVPLGAFLSGGVDSSTIVALMQQKSTKPVKTFSIGFFEDEYNEAAYAKAVASHLGTEHTEL